MSAMTQAQPDAAATPTPGAWWCAAAVTVVLAAFGGRYGLHRDELYFVEAGHHPAWGYPDQPPLVPLLATAWSAVSGGSVLAFRLVPAVLAGLVVLVAAATSRALGGRPRDQMGTAVVMACSTLVLATGHLFSTTTFDVLLTALAVLLLVRALAATAPDSRALGRWLLLGAVAGVAMEVKTLPATVLAACGIALLLVGPRRPLLTPGPWLAALVAGVLAAPNLLWQARNGWPQLELARAIAAGSSGTSAQRWAIVPLQITLLGLTAPLIVVGVVVALRSPWARLHRWVAVAYLVLLAFVVVTGGKPYYTAGLLPALVALAMPASLDWAARRRLVAGMLLAAGAVITAVVALPILPVRATGPLIAVNYDAGETIGWPAFVRTVESVTAAIPAADRARAVILTSNYGEAGALDRARRAGSPLPPVYSGHNAYGLWGPPPDGRDVVVLVGRDSDARMGEYFRTCRLVAWIDNRLGIDNDEQGAPVRVCAGLVAPWGALWPHLTHLG